MPFEEFILGLVFISGGIILLALKMIINYQKWKRGYTREGKKAKRSATGDSIGLAELEALFLEASETANAPLLARLDAIEQQIETAELNRPLMDAIEGEDVYVTSAQKTVGRTVRQR